MGTVVNNLVALGVRQLLPVSVLGDDGQAFDLFAPFTETLYPFLFKAPEFSQLASQFGDSGFFVATLDMDTKNALSNLYPTPGYLATRGSIEGRVLLQLDTSSIPISGINVIARRIDQGSFPPAAGVSAFPIPPGPRPPLLP